MGNKKKRNKGKKTGSNDPCSCGGGKKYKKCCRDKVDIIKEPVPKEVMEHLQKEMMITEKLKSVGIYINYVRPIMFKGKKVWAIGSTVYHNRPPNETFHEFIVFILKITLGQKWWEEQLGLPQEKQHFIMQSFQAHNNWKIRMQSSATKIDDNIWAAIPDGWSRGLISLAFDVATLTHAQRLPEHLITRLKTKDQYQGARYEVAVAAMIARLNCKIEFLDTTTSDKHCEFIATHNESGQVFGVEAKSRHRKGVLHTEGITKDEEKLLKGDVNRIFNESLKQRPAGMPYYIFIDLNSPMTPGKEMQEKPWFKGVQKILSRQGTPTQENPDLFNGIFITNFSYHYQSFRKADPGEVLSVIPLIPENKPDKKDMTVLIHQAASNYGNVPDLDIETRF
ncbi:SEC-C domain-containing protein [bacterium]|nr:SEC-C domain-containing protein [bacterium]